MVTKTINLRDVPEDFVRQAKAYAALQGLSLKDFILRAVRQVLEAAGPELEIASRSFFVSAKAQQKSRRRARRKQT